MPKLRTSRLLAALVAALLAVLLAAPLTVTTSAAAPGAHASPAAASSAPTADAGLRFLQPTGSRLQGTVDLAVAAPADTTAVRFFLDDVQLSEITDLYATQTKTTPQWATATDVGWFPAGAHTLRAEAVTPSGTIETSEQVVTAADHAAPGTEDLDGGWRFQPARDLPPEDTAGDVPPVASPSYDDSDWPRIVVPDSWGAVRDAWNDDAGLVGVYRRSIDLDAALAGEQTALVFDSCFWQCTYFVNGTPVGSSVGGYLPTRLDVTHAVHPGANQLTVLVDNRTSTMGGYATPVQGLYWNFGGILQQVHLERTPAVALTETRAEGTLSGRLTLRPTGVNATGADQTVRAQLTVDGPDGSRVLGPRTVTTTVPAGGGQATPITLDLANVQPWDLDHPRLYTVHLRPQGDAAWHELVEHTGFRDVAVRGLDVLLNGKPVEDLQGFDRHADYPGLGRTQPDGLADREIKALHDKGFRIFRPAHYPTTPAELDAADKYGLLVIEEVNNVTSQPGDFLARTDVQEYGERTLQRMIDRDRSHPSLIAWSVGNENATDTAGGADYVKNVIGYGRTADPTRLYTQVSNQSVRDLAYPYEDFFATNYYAGWYQTLDSLESHLDAVQAMAKMPVLLSEYGAEAIYGRPGLGKGTEYYQAMIVDEHNRLLDDRPHFLGKMYWTSTEFWCTPTWGSGQTPDPVPPFHTKALETYTRQQKLGWRVMFSPIRITAANVLEAPEGERVTVHEHVTIADVRGQSTRGVVRVDAPDGFTAPDVPFSVAANGSTTVDVPLTGTVTEQYRTQQGFVHAIVDSDTEALPHPFTIDAEDAVVSPASDDFDSAQLDGGWQIVRPNAAGWSLGDRPGSLRLSTLPGGETQKANTGANLFVRTTTPGSDWTADAEVEAADLSANSQQIGLYAYADDDDYAKVDLGWIDGRRAIEVVVEQAGAFVTHTSVPYDGDTAHLRLVRRGGTVTAEYSADGTTWFELGSGPVAGTPRVALQAVGGSTAPPTVATYVDRLDVRTSGRVEATGIAVPGQPVIDGQQGDGVVTVVNGADHDVPVRATLDVPAPWSAGSADATVPAFGSVAVHVPITTAGPPTAATVTASVTATDGTGVSGTPTTTVVTTPAASSSALALDAGTATSPVFDGYQRLSTQAWDPARGYGWVGTVPQSRDRGAPDPLMRDIVTGQDPAVLRIAVPAGTHDVDLLVGDHSYAGDPMTVTGDGRTLATVDPAVPSGTFQWKRFTLDGGTDGRTVDLTFAARDQGAYWRFASLVLE